MGLTELSPVGLSGLPALNAFPRRPSPDFRHPKSSFGSPIFPGSRGVSNRRSRYAVFGFELEGRCRVTTGRLATSVGVLRLTPVRLRPSVELLERRPIA
jgi:hypothetical protein